MPDPFRRLGAPRLALAGLALLCLAPSAGQAMTGGPGYAYRAAARPAKVWRAQPTQARAFPAKPAAKAKPVEAKPAGSAEAASADKPASTESTATSSATWTSGEQDRACFRSRRKLWQDGEGWVVKKVSVCP